MAEILIVVDMQKDFVDGALGTAEAQMIVPAAVEKIKNFNGEIYCTMDTHGEDYLKTQEGQKLPVEHCLRGTKGWTLNERILQAVDGRAHFIEKPTFGSLDLAVELMRIYVAEKIERIELIGLCTDICVVSNALLLKAAMPEIPIAVDAACCAGVTPATHKAALETMRMCQIEVVNG